MGKHYKPKMTGPFSNDSIPMPDDVISAANEDLGDFYHTLMRLKMKDALKSDEERNSPDTFGAKVLFLDSFLTDKMHDDFSLIARDFFLHEYKNIDDHETVIYVSTDPNENYPDQLFENYVLNLMMNAVDAGSDYARNLFLYLYKIYYSREYKQLKRFSSLSLSELLSLARNDNDIVSPETISRILVISSMNGVNISTECNFIYDFLNDLKKDLPDEADWEYVDEVFDTYWAHKDEINEIFEDDDEMIDMVFEFEQFQEAVLRSQAYPEDYLYLCDRHDDGIVDRLQRTLSVLKVEFPDKKFTKEELVIYSSIYHCISALCSSTESIENRMDEVIYGPKATDFYDDHPPLFKSEDVMKGRNEIVKPAGKKDEIKSPSDGSPKYREDVLLKEIEDLHRKLHIQESDIKQLKAENAGRQKAQEEIRKLKEQMEFEHKELAALREHLYNMTEEDSREQSVPIAEMKDFLKGFRIIIVGGHKNWQTKMKQEFPGWTYIDATVSGTVEDSIVNKADYVYFFTDTISHSTYFRYMNVVRERGINFGYIHGVNIENNIRGMYRELKK